MMPPDVQAPSLTVVGAINLDLTAQTARAPARGETVADGVLRRMPGGKGANQAIAAARLGARVRLIGAVGNDDDGRAMAANARSAGVDVSAVQITTLPTGVALIIVDAQGENSIVVCPGANTSIDVSAVEIREDENLLGQLEVPPEVVSELAARTSGFVAVNASPADRLPVSLRRRADLIIVNESEHAVLPEIGDAPLVALTLGARGAVLLERGREIARSEVRAAQVVNTVGAGDAFAAALTLGLLRGDGAGVSLARACAVGAAAVADPASQPDLQPLWTYPAH